MDPMIEALFHDVQTFTPSTSRDELEYLIFQMSHRSGIGPVSLLTSLREDLRNGIPFRYTAVGKSRAAFHWKE